MEIKQIIDMIMKRIWLIIVFTLIVGAISAYINFMVFVPVYQADTTLMITGLSSSVNNTGNTTDPNNTGNTSMSFEDIIAGQSLISEYSAIINSKRVTSAVAKKLNDSSITEEDLRQMISISSVNETRIIDISILYPDPVKAAKIADIVAEVFSQEVVGLYKIENVNIIDKAEVPKAPVAPTKKKNIALSLLAAGIIAVSFVFLLEFMNNKVKTSEDVEKHLGLNVIGSIPVNTLGKERGK